MPAIRGALAVAAARAHAAAAGVAGDSPSLYDVRSASQGDLIRLVPVAVLVIGLLLALLLRSAIAPIYLVVSVALSYLASLGVSVIVFQILGGDYGLSFILPFLMFIFLLALGEDYNILVMSRIREEAHDLPLRDGGGAGHRGHRHHGHLGGDGARRDLPGLRHRRGGRLRGSADPGDRPRAHHRGGAGHVRGADAHRPVRGRPARALELVAGLAAPPARPP